MIKKLIVNFQAYVEIETDNYPGMTDVKKMVKADIDNDAAMFFDGAVINEDSIKVIDLAKEAPSEY